MSRHRLHRLHTPLALLTLFAMGCDDPIGSGTARVSLALTDALGDVASVWVDIGEIYLQGGEGRIELLGEEDADLLGLVELTELAGTTMDLVSDVEVPAGTYGQLRFVIDGAVLETMGGDVYTYNAEHPLGTMATGSLTCPSCSQSGIKVVLQGDEATLEAGAHLYMLDFDVSQSFGHDTGTDRWVMHPVILGADVSFTGAVTGTVDVDRDDMDEPLVEIPECPAGEPRDLTAFVPTAVAETLTDDSDDPLTVTTIVDTDGSFAFPFLLPDVYDFTYAADVVFDDDTLKFAADAPGPVEVTTGADLTVDYVITSATCVEVS